MAAGLDGFPSCSSRHSSTAAKNGLWQRRPINWPLPVVAGRPRRAERIEVNFDASRKELGVEDGLKDIPGVTTRMLVAFGKHGIKSIEDLADCATDDLIGWSETKDEKTIRHTGILGRFKVSRQDCEAMIMNARTKAGWFK
jgi:hypothetical protein